jgi:alpha-tubulin suppressor-like RCC1 family protein
MTTKGVWDLQDVRDKLLAGDNWENTQSFYVWGQNEYGALGQNSRVDLSSPTQVPGSWLLKGTTISNENNAAGVKYDGTMWVWGYNGDNGKLGLNAPGPSHKSSPTQLGTGTDWKMAKVSGYAINMLKTDGTMWVTGGNGAGFLGLNAPGPSHKSSPTQIPGTTWDEIPHCANQSIVASKTDGTFWTWGFNQSGQLGLNIEGGNPGNNSLSSPTQLPGTTWSTDDTKWGGGMNFKSTIKTDGTLWAWGMRDYGQLGLNSVGTSPTNTGISSPMQVGSENTWKTITGGKYYFSGGTKTDGTLWVWGRNDDDAQLGLNDRTSRSSPTQIPGTTWNEVSAGVNCFFATKTDGTLWAWGSQYKGGLGLNSNTSTGTSRYSSPVQVGTNTLWDKLITNNRNSRMNAAFLNSF